MYVKPVVVSCKHDWCYWLQLTTTDDKLWCLFRVTLVQIKHPCVCFFSSFHQCRMKTSVILPLIAWFSFNLAGCSSHSHGQQNLNLIRLHLSTSVLRFKPEDYFQFIKKNNLTSALRRSMNTLCILMYGPLIYKFKFTDETWFPLK